MARQSSFTLLLLLLLGLTLRLSLAQEEEVPGAADAPAQPAAVATEGGEEEDEDWGLDSLRGSFQAVNGYFDSMLEFLGGRDGVCQHKCRYGKAPVPRPNYEHPPPDGCSAYFLGLPLPEAVDLGIPAITKCCNQLDLCYTTCGSNKYRCDSKFRWCLHSICTDLKKSLGLMSKVEACETVADTLFNTVWTLGCRPYMNGQREACLCEGEERDEL
ncbi:group XIIB secretory phospholipase A2-like protein [Alosa sapidissima]|uniref:group XIIB secretory phospholipase A2-like protein n=1 Tax=Alosa sapidissima TaxID=34773 RepID=UPI001C096D84|nr:group XIIB secretory phospholipase A2-like protein [Alosa sapidissima]